MTSHEKGTQEYWEAAIQDFFKLGMMTATVPKAGLNYNIAKTIARKLDANLSVEGNDYIFWRNSIEKSHEEHQQPNS